VYPKSGYFFFSETFIKTLKKKIFKFNLIYYYLFFFFFKIEHLIKIKDIKKKGNSTIWWVSPCSCLAAELRSAAKARPICHSVSRPSITVFIILGGTEAGYFFVIINCRTFCVTYYPIRLKFPFKKNFFNWILNDACWKNEWILSRLLTSHAHTNV
jgi:hypothetical protein